MVICADQVAMEDPKGFSERELATGRQTQLPMSTRVSGLMNVIDNHGTIAFGPSSRVVYVLTRSMKGSFVERWSTFNGQKDPEFKIPVPGDATHIALSSTGTEMAVSTSGDGPSQLLRFDLESGELLSRSSSSNYSKIEQIQYTSNANHLLIGGDAGNIHVSGLGRMKTYSWGYSTKDDYDIFPAVLNRLMSHPSSGVFVTIGNQWATADMVDEFNSKVKGAKRTVRTNYQDFVKFESSPDGKEMTAAYMDGSASVFDLSTGNEIAYLDPRNPIARAREDVPCFKANVYYSDDGEYIVTHHETLALDHPYQARFSLWDGQFKSLIRSTTVGFGTHYVPLEHPALAQAYADGSVDLVDLASGRTFLQIEGTKDITKKVAATPDGKYLFTMTEFDISVWDLKNRKHRVVYFEPTLQPDSMRISPDGKTLVVVAVTKQGRVEERVFLLKTNLDQ